MKRYIRSDIPLDCIFPGNPDDRAFAARYTDVEDLLYLYTYDPEPQVNRSAAVNPNLPTDCLEYLSDSSDALTRQMVAEHSNTSEDVLYKLSHDEDKLVRLYAIINKNLPARAISEVWDAWGVNGGLIIATAFLHNHNTPSYVLEGILNSGILHEQWEYLELVEHPNVNAEILHQLSESADAQVSNAAKARLDGRL